MPSVGVSTSDDRSLDYVFRWVQRASFQWSVRDAEMHVAYLGPAWETGHNCRDAGEQIVREKSQFDFRSPSEKCSCFQQFVVSHDAIVDYDSVEFDVDWSTTYTPEELKWYVLFVLSCLHFSTSSFVNTPSYYAESLMDSYIEVKPSDIELAFLLCNICLRLTGVWRILKNWNYWTSRKEVGRPVRGDNRAITGRVSW